MAFQKQNYFQRRTKPRGPRTNERIRAKEVQGDQQRYEQLRQTAYQEMQKKQAEGLQPIVEKAQKAVEEVADAKGILYVLDASIGKGVLVKKGEDLMAAVKTKLGF